MADNQMACATCEPKGLCGGKGLVTFKEGAWANNPLAIQVLQHADEHFAGKVFRHIRRHPVAHVLEHLRIKTGAQDGQRFGFAHPCPPQQTHQLVVVHVSLR